MTNLYITILVLLLTISNIFPFSFLNMENNIEQQIIRNIENITTDISNVDTIPEYYDYNYIPTITINKNEPIIESYYRYEITEKEFEEFVRVVEAEVTGDHPFGTSYEEAFQSKLHVAQVILNRVESPYFPNTVHDVIFQKNAFTPLVDGRYWEVEISQVTIDACKTALLASTEDTTYGCEFFSSGTKTCKYGSYVFTDDVGHSFFKTYRND